MRSELDRWNSVGMASAALLCSVLSGCLQSLDAKPAYSLARASLMLTEGLPTLLPRMRRQLAPDHQAALRAVHGSAGDVCRAVQDALTLIEQCLPQPSSSTAQAVPGVPPAAAVARLLRSTALRPPLVVGALDRLTGLMALDAGLIGIDAEGSKGEAWATVVGATSHALPGCAGRWLAQHLLTLAAAAFHYPPCCFATLPLSPAPLHPAPRRGQVAATGGVPPDQRGGRG